MQESVEEIYQQIANAMVREIKGDWADAWLEVEITNDYAALDGRYHKPGNPTIRGFSVDMPVLERFKTLRFQLQKSGEDPWRWAKFTLFPDGKFTIDFRYDDAV